MKFARVIEQKPETDVEPEPETTKRPNRSSIVNKEVKGGLKAESPKRTNNVTPSKILGLKARDVGPLKWQNPEWSVLSRVSTTFFGEKRITGKISAFSTSFLPH